jgi:type VI secretion system secreted protein Hcp
MGIGSWLRRPGKAAVLIAVGAAGGGAALAVASIPDSNGVIHGCVELEPGSTIPLTSGANLRVIDPAAQQTCSTTNPAGGLASEEAVSWNTVGPQGAPGATGTPGPAGHTLTINGSTFSVGNGRTATVTSSPTLAPFQITGNTKPVGTVTFTGGVRAAGADSASSTPSSGDLVSDILDWGFTTESTGAGRGAGGGAAKPKFGDLHIVKTVDKASPTLFKACASGKHFASVTLVVRKAGGGTSLTITMDDVLISSYQTGGSSSGERPTESLSLNFTKIEFQYTKQGKTPTNSKPITTLQGVHL